MNAIHVATPYVDVTGGHSIVEPIIEVLVKTPSFSFHIKVNRFIRLELTNNHSQLVFLLLFIILSISLWNIVSILFLRLCLKWNSSKYPCKCSLLQ